jgi:rare lipoprotein A
VTKRRPSWSKWLRQVAAFACGLLLLNAAPAVWAAGKKVSAKQVSAKQVSAKQVSAKQVSAKPAHARPAKKAAFRSGRPALPATEFGPADLIDDDLPGLRGQASFYGNGFQGRRTATGERFDVRQFTAASNRFPLGTLLAVRRLDKDLCAIVKVNDRMHGKHRKRIIDVSRSAAEYLGMLRAGVVFVSVAPVRGAGPNACATAFEAAPDEESYGKPEKMPKIEFGSD